MPRKCKAEIDTDKAHILKITSLWMNPFLPEFDTLQLQDEEKKFEMWVH